MNESQLSTQIRDNFEKFISHYVWSTNDKSSSTYFNRISNRYSEMFSRRRKLLRSNIKKELLDEGNARAAENVTEIDN
jgi:hypothetical protein